MIEKIKIFIKVEFNQFVDFYSLIFILHKNDSEMLGTFTLKSADRKKIAQRIQI